MVQGGRSTAQPATKQPPANAPVGSPEWCAQVQASAKQLPAGLYLGIDDDDDDANHYDRVAADIAQASPAIGALHGLAAAIREAANQVAIAVETVMWEMDRERRGSLSAAARQDEVETARTVCDLLKAPLLDDEGRERVRKTVAAECARLPEPRSPADRLARRLATKAARGARGKRKRKPRTNPPRRPGARQVRR